MSIEDKLTELGITLPEAPAAVAAYQPWIRTGNLIFTSGQLPFRDGEIAFAGKLGAEVSDEDGYQAARRAALNALAQIKSATGDLDKVQKIVRIEGYIHCAEGYRGHPQVLNGASDLIAEICCHRFSAECLACTFERCIRLGLGGAQCDDNLVRGP